MPDGKYVPWYGVVGAALFAFGVGSVCARLARGLFPELVAIVSGIAFLLGGVVAYYIAQLVVRSGQTNRARMLASAGAAVLGVSAWAVLRFGGLW